MTTSSGNARSGSSRYESRPVGGPEDGPGSPPAPYGQAPSQPGPGTTYGEEPPTDPHGGSGPAPGYGGGPEKPGTPGYGSGPEKPGTPGYGSGPESPGTPGYGSGPEKPGTPGYGSGPENPGTPGYGSGPENPGTPGYGSGPENPGTPGYGSGPESPGTPGYGSGPEKPGTPGYGGGASPATPDVPAGQGEPTGGFGPDDPNWSGDPGQPPPTTPTPSHPCPPSSKSCDTGSVDDLNCQAEALKAESKAMSDVAEASASRRTKFDSARTAYIKARDAAVLARKVGDAADTTVGDAPVKKGLEKRVARVVHDESCKLNLDQQVVDCITRAFDQVVDCLRECGDDQGCCAAQDCDFTSQTWTVDQIEGLRTRVKKCEDCFDNVLVVEPDALTERVTKLKAKVDLLETTYDKVDESTIEEERKKIYAGAKEAEWLLQRLWGAFPDVNTYQDCLCSAFTCSLKGRAWLAELEGQKKYQECQELSRKARCATMREKIVEETLATELVLCPPTSGEGDQPAEANATV